MFYIFLFKLCDFFPSSVNWLKFLYHVEWTVVALNLRWKDFNLLSRSTIIGVHFTWMPFIKLKKLLPCSNYDVFNHKWLWNFVKLFFCINFDDHMVFLFHFVDIMNSIDCFSSRKPNLHYWNKP